MNKKIIIGIIVVLLLIGGGVLFKKQQDKVAAQAVKDNTIKIVTSMPVRGLGGPMVNGMKLAMEEAGNKAGSFTIDFVIVDDADEKGALLLDVEKKTAQEAVADPNVMMYIGPAYSGAAKISIPITNQGGIAQLGISTTYGGLTQAGAAGEPGIYYPTGKQTFFRTAPTVAWQGPAGAVWAKDELGVKSVYIVDDSDLYGKNVSNLFEKKAKDLGLIILGRTSIMNKEPIGIQKTINDIVKQKPDLVYFGGLVTGGVVPLFKGLREKGSSTKLMGSHGILASSFVADMGKNAEGIFITSNSGETPSSAGIITDREKIVNNKYTKKFGTEPAVYSIASYEAIKVALAAIERAGVKDRAAIVKSLSETKDYDGLFGKFSFDEHGDTTLKPKVSVNVVKDGKIEFIKALAY